ncbi:MAG: TVP38/TMEM64 family protein [Paracoccaceae bacterium]
MVLINMAISKRIIVLMLIAGLAVTGGYALNDVFSIDMLRLHRAELLSITQSHKVLAALLFVSLYSVIAGLSLPGAAIASIAGGFLFGLMLGTILNITAATLGATSLYLAVQWGVGESFVRRLDALEGRSDKIVSRLRKNEVSVLLSLRLVPIVPFFAVNLLAAISRVGFRNFVLTTSVGILPGAIVFTSIGVGLGSVFDQGAEPDLSVLWSPQLLFPLLGLAALSLVPMFWKNKSETE